jgi:hypothetical protein
MHKQVYWQCNFELAVTLRNIMIFEIPFLLERYYTRWPFVETCLVDHSIKKLCVVTHVSFSVLTGISWEILLSENE